MDDYAQIFKGRDGQFYYRIKSGGNHKVITAGGEGYKRKADVVSVLTKHFPGILVADLDSFHEVDDAA